MINSLFFLLLFLFSIVYLFIGKVSETKETNVVNFFLEKKRYGVFALTMTLLATQLGGGSILGAAEEAYQRGWIVLFYPAGIALGLLVLGVLVGTRLQRSDLKTTAELFERVYQSPFLRKMASVLSIVTLLLIFIAMGIATKKFFSSVGLESPFLFYLFWGVVIFYTAQGGLNAVVATDILQMIVTIGVLLGVFFVANNKALSLPVMNVDFTSSTPLPWVAWMLMPFLFMFIEQDMGQRCFAAKSQRSIKWAGLFSSVLLFLGSSFAIYFGIMARKTGLTIPEGESVLMTAMMQFSNPLMTTFFGVALLMLIISTADSLLCSALSNLAFDFPKMEMMSKKSAQFLTFGIGIGAILLSTLFTKIVPLMIISYELSVMALFVPIIAAIFAKGTLPKQAALVSIILGIMGFSLFRMIPLPIPKELATLFLSLGGFYVGLLVSRQPLRRPH